MIFHFISDNTYMFVSENKDLTQDQACIDKSMGKYHVSKGNMKKINLADCEKLHAA